MSTRKVARQTPRKLPSAEDFGPPPAPKRKVVTAARWRELGSSPDCLPLPEPSEPTERQLVRWLELAFGDEGELLAPVLESVRDELNVVHGALQALDAMPLARVVYRATLRLDLALALVAEDERWTAEAFARHRAIIAEHVSVEGGAQ